MMMTITMKVVIMMEVTVVEIMSKNTTAMNVNVKIQILVQEMEEIPHNPVVNMQFTFNLKGSN